MADVMDEVVKDHQDQVEASFTEVPFPDGYWKERVRSDGRVFYIGYETNWNEDSKKNFESSIQIM